MKNLTTRKKKFLIRCDLHLICHENTDMCVYVFYIFFLLKMSIHGPHANMHTMIPIKIITSHKKQYQTEKDFHLYLTDFHLYLIQMALDSSDFSFVSLLVLVFPEYENTDPGLLGSSPVPFYMLISAPYMWEKEYVQRCTGF